MIPDRHEGSARYAIACFVRERVLAGRSVPSEVVALDEWLRTHPMSCSGHETVSATADLDMMTSAEAADILGTTQRHMARLAPTLGGVKRSNRWWIPRREIERRGHGDIESVTRS